MTAFTFEAAGATWLRPASGPVGGTAPAAPRGGGRQRGARAGEREEDREPHGEEASEHEQQNDDRDRDRAFTRQGELVDEELVERLVRAHASVADVERGMLCRHLLRGRCGGR